MKSLNSISSFKVLSKEEQVMIKGGYISGGFVCKNGNIKVFGDFDSVAQIKESAKNSCFNQGGVGYTYWFEEMEDL